MLDASTADLLSIASIILISQIVMLGIVEVTRRGPWT